MSCLAVLVFCSAPVSALLRPRFGGTVVRGYLGELRGLNPASAASAAEREAARQVHAGLYRFGAAGEPVPDLVERAELAADGQSVRLVLGPARFHDGRPVTAEDARQSIERFAATPGPGALLGGGRDPVRPVASVVGERELVVRIDGARALWPWLLADLGAAVVPSGGDGSIGAGPFALDRAPRAAGAGIRLVANGEHRRGRPFLDAIEYRPFADEKALLLAHRHQGVELVEPPSASDETETAAEETVLLRLNLSRPPLDAAWMRQAIAGAVRRDALVEVVLGGRGEAATTLLRLRPVIGAASAAAAGAVTGVATAVAERPATRPLTLVYPEGAGLKSVAERLRVDLHSAGIAAVPQGLSASAHAATLGAVSFDLALVVLTGSDLPPAVALASLAALTGHAPPAPLLAASSSADPGASHARDLFAVEDLLLGSGDALVLFRRRRALLAAAALHEVRLGADGIALLEDAWRWEAASGELLPGARR